MVLELKEKDMKWIVEGKQNTQFIIWFPPDKRETLKAAWFFFHLQSIFTLIIQDQRHLFTASVH